MNIVKGVADLIRRSSGGQAVEGGSWTQADKLSAPSPRIRFRDAGEEAVLNTLWQRYENAIDKAEKRKLLQVFLMHFIQTYETWEPVHNGQLPVELASSSDDVVAGCSAGHPSEVILILVQEIARITSIVTKLNNSAGQVNPDQSEPSTSLSFSTEDLYVLNCLTIITRSMHNCSVFSYYGGVQKVTALLKAAVVQLKTLTSVLVDEQLINSSVEKTRVLQKILVFVVSVIYSFMELHSFVHKDTPYIDTISEDSLPEVSQSSLKVPLSEERNQWQKKAIILVMEAGGVNWLVELLRVIRRLNLKDQGTDLSLHYLALGALKSALYENPRAQNHFRSIGGLEVLLDGLGLPSSKFSFSRRNFFSGDES